ncbi:MAG: YibE/F family protein [Candidatus Falkowbacteria bacterium]
MSYAFVSLAKLTGAASEEVLFLLNIPGAQINLQGLLLAGIIIGSLGVLDDVVISQVSTTEQISHANHSLSKAEVFKKSYKVGVSHIASMTNTLFMAYAGASLPILILFVSGESAFANWGQAVNTELIAQEIIRTLAGSIGLIMSVPIATFLASWKFGGKSKIEKILKKVE